jgi:hypothetical protein
VRPSLGAYLGRAAAEVGERGNRLQRAMRRRRRRAFAFGRSLRSAAHAGLRTRPRGNELTSCGQEPRSGFCGLREQRACCGLRSQKFCAMRL